MLPIGRKNRENLFRSLDGFREGLTETLFSKIFLEGNTDDEIVGEISVQVDLFTQAGSGEHKVTAKGKVVWVAN